MNEREFRQVLTEARDEMIQILREHWTANRPPNAGDVNCGLCYEFAQTVSRKVSEAEIHHHKGKIEHWWVYWNGRHYDAECIDGVHHWKDLPIFKTMK